MGIGKKTKNGGRNVPHLYLYTWIRVSCWFSLIINSIIMYFISSSESVLDEIFVRKDLFFILTAILGILGISLCSNYGRYPNTLINVIVDSVEIGFLFVLYLCDNINIIFFCFLELFVIIFFGIKIDKNNNIIDNLKIVLWWKGVQRKRFEKAVERELQRYSKKNKIVKVELTEEQKLKKMSRKQRKEYKEKRR